jgi:hypothetical protein
MLETDRMALWLFLRNGWETNMVTNYGDLKITNYGDLKRSYILHYRGSVTGLANNPHRAEHSRILSHIAY